MVIFVGTSPFRRIALWFALETMHESLDRGGGGLVFTIH